PSSEFTRTSSSIDLIAFCLYRRRRCFFIASSSDPAWDNQNIKNQQFLLAARKER
ncbi:MAG: hypothetical protein Q9204_006917, partial [Flavoplaca sp. TL-2023a]